MATIPSALNLAPSTRFTSFMGTSLLGSSGSVFFNNNINGRANLSLVLCGSRRISRNQKKGMSCNCLFGLGVPELVVIAGVAALCFRAQADSGSRPQYWQVCQELPTGSTFSIDSGFEGGPASADILMLSVQTPKSLSRPTAAKEFETELKKDTDYPLESPENITRVSGEEKQEAKVSSKESS